VLRPRQGDVVAGIPVHDVRRNGLRPMQRPTPPRFDDRDANPAVIARSTGDHASGDEHPRSTVFCVRLGERCGWHTRFEAHARAVEDHCEARVAADQEHRLDELRDSNWPLTAVQVSSLMRYSSSSSSTTASTTLSSSVRPAAVAPSAIAVISSSANPASWASARVGSTRSSRAGGRWCTGWRVHGRGRPVTTPGSARGSSPAMPWQVWGCAPRSRER